MGRGGNQGLTLDEIEVSISRSEINSSAINARNIKAPDMRNFPDPVKARKSTWFERRMVTFDIESTGVDVEEDRIVTASMSFVGGGRETVTKKWLVNPGVEIPEEATSIHGISNHEASANGQQPKQAIQEMLDLLAEAAKENQALVVYNARFDISLLDREAKRNGLTPLTERADPKVIDPFVIDKAVDPYRSGSRKLVDTCRNYDIEFNEKDAHDADADSINAARLAYRLGKRNPSLNIPLEELHNKQVAWAKEQAEGLQKHLASKGKNVKISPNWPLA
jgi:DNA polymerase-3 subunit epsilon